MLGKTLGPYLIEKELGSGGMGRVYAATLERSTAGLAPGTRVALKVVHPQLLDTEGFFKRFLREAEIGKTVRHPNVVRTFDCDATGDQHFLAMEYVEGQTLRDLLDELGRVPEELCRHVGIEIAKGLAAIHAAGAIHRDVKPENVLITQDHVVKVMDLGVARLAGEALRLSQTGAFVGSLHYAAPESFRQGGKHVDGRIDLHALGLVLYELACGTNPYAADDVPRTVRKVLHEEPRKLGEINPQFSPFFEEVVHCLLEKDRAKRFATGDELAEVLADGEDSAWWRRRASLIRTVTKRPLRRVRIPRETAVYGRDEELAKLRALYDAAKAGEGNVVLIEGEAGIGKSRLVDELIGRIQRDGEDINFLFGSYPPGGAATAAGGFSTAYREQFGEAGCAAYLPTTPVLVPAFDALLRGEPTPEGKEPLTKGSLQTCFVNANRALAAERPTVVLIDDLHFAPEEGRSLFTSLAMAVPGHRVLLIGTTRPGVSEEWLAGATRLDQTSQLALQRLGPKHLMALLRDTLNSERLAQELGVQIATKSDGNPFFVFEILRGLREGRSITQQEDGTWVGTEVVDDIQIPSSVLDLVNARVAELSEEERDLLDVACCWGFEFDPGLIGEVLGSGRIPLLKLFGQIERRHRLVRASGRNYVFDHHQVQEALYGTLHEQMREEYHAALGEALETRTRAAETDPDTLDGAVCVDLCEHFLKGARGGRALRYLAAAQDHLNAGYLPAQVVDLTERALAFPGLLAGVERAETLLRLVHALDARGLRARQEECSREVERLAAEAGDEPLRVRAMNSLGTLFWRTSRAAEAEQVYRQGLELARTLGDAGGEAAVTGGLGLVCLSLGRLSEAVGYHERQLELVRETGDRVGESRATGNLGNAYWAQGRLPEAREHHERNLALSRAIGYRRGVAAATGNLGIVCLVEGRLVEARALQEQHLALSRELGDRQGEATSTGNLGLVLSSDGRLAEALEQFERHLELSREIGHGVGAGVALVNLGDVWLELGAIERAREVLASALALNREIGARSGEGYALLGLSRVAEEAGDLAGALSLLGESLTLRREIGEQGGVLVSLVELGDCRRRAGDAHGAREALDEALSLARELDTAPPAALAAAILACLPDEDAAAAERALDEAGESGDSPRVQYLLWTATSEAAHLDQAKRLLDQACAKVPDEYHESMLANVRVNREILAAHEEHGGETPEAQGHP